MFPFSKLDTIPETFRSLIAFLIIMSPTLAETAFEIFKPFVVDWLSIRIAVVVSSPVDVLCSVFPVPQV